MVTGRAPAQQLCAYCKKRSEGLEKLRSTNKLRMMQKNDPEYNRDTLFCRVCRPRIDAKYQHEKANRSALAGDSSVSSERTGSYSFIPSLDGRSNTSSNSSAAGPSHQQPAGRGDRSPAKKRTSSSSHDASSDDANRGDATSRASADNANRSSTSTTSGRNQPSPKRPRIVTSPIEFDHGTSNSNRSSRQSTSGSNSQESGQNQQAEFEVDVHFDDNDLPNVSILAPMPRIRPIRQPAPTRPPTPERMASTSASGRSSLLYQRPGGG